MIISCPSCQAQFRVDESALGPGGKKVRCSKCSHVWRALPGKQPPPAAPTVEQPASETAVEVAPETSVEPPAPASEAEERAQPTLSAGGDEASGQNAPTPEAAKQGESGTTGLTDDQRAKLAAARQHKSRGRFWIKVLLIFVIVLGLLALAQRMIPKLNHEQAGPTMEQAPAPAEPEPMSPGVDSETPAE